MAVFTSGAPVSTITAASGSISRIAPSTAMPSRPGILRSVTVSGGGGGREKPRPAGRAGGREGRETGGGVREEDHNNLAPAVAGHDVDTPRVLDQNLRDLPQRLVADGVAQVVVDRLEPVEIHEDHRDRVVEAPMALHLLLEPDREEAAGAATRRPARSRG